MALQRTSNRHKQNIQLKNSQGMQPPKSKKKAGTMSKAVNRIALHVILVGVTLALPFIAQHFGWLSTPPLLAPGIK
jgi:hypothetical protein